MKVKFTSGGFTDYETFGVSSIPEGKDGIAEVVGVVLNYSIWDNDESECYFFMSDGKVINPEDYIDDFRTFLETSEELDKNAWFEVDRDPDAAVAIKNDSEFYKTCFHLTKTFLAVN